MKFGLIIIGDEIISGKRQDKHFEFALSAFSKRGLALDWVLYLGDDRLAITQQMKIALDSGAVVFSCGGIGATPDDHTRQAVAGALDTHLVLHPQAQELITERCRQKGEPDMSSPENQGRLKMGEFPLGAQIVHNPYNLIPGFSVQGKGQARLYCLPGFPVMAWPMLESVLDQNYSHLFHKNVQTSRSMLVYGLPESSITPLMEQVEKQYPPVKAFSLPSVGDGVEKPHIELGCKASIDAKDQVDLAFSLLETGVIALGGTTA